MIFIYSVAYQQMFAINDHYSTIDKLFKAKANMCLHCHDLGKQLGHIYFVLMCQTFRIFVMNVW